MLLKDKLKWNGIKEQFYFKSVKKLLTAIVILCFSANFVGCKMRYFTDDLNTYYWHFRFSRSTVYKEIMRLKCYNSKSKKLESRSIVFHQTGCWGETTYLGYKTEYYQNGKLKLKTRFRKKHSFRKEYYSNGGLKVKEKTHTKRIISDTLMYDLPNNLTGRGKKIVRIRTVMIDSIFHRRITKSRIDTVPIVRMRF
jgi:hypothetical protein